MLDLLTAELVSPAPTHFKIAGLAELGDWAQVIAWCPLIKPLFSHSGWISL
jgi:hypothetical protein